MQEAEGVGLVLRGCRASQTSCGTREKLRENLDFGFEPETRFLANTVLQVLAVVLVWLRREGVSVRGWWTCLRQVSARVRS